jgi:hypothetical protein
MTVTVQKRYIAGNHWTEDTEAADSCELSIYDERIRYNRTLRFECADFNRMADIEKMLEAAHDQGQRDARQQIRSALGIGKAWGNTDNAAIVK